MSNADADGLSRRPDVNISSEQNTIETPVIKAVSLAASVSKDQAPLIFSVAAPTDSADERTIRRHRDGVSYFSRLEEVPD
ncbi:hypothetical protein DPMN_044464 [Dreissena polymorpha]|uniref:Uncharacterized protein n=1 Tax=Dreissena polymorpha TaxID=45954 RepID=A0A9D4D2B9_DREPO|nr:hypothetical protein DPMN_044464 [Dreissena polymorpha]